MLSTICLTFHQCWGRFNVNWASSKKGVVIKKLHCNTQTTKHNTGLKVSYSNVFIINKMRKQCDNMKGFAHGDEPTRIVPLICNFPWLYGPRENLVILYKIVHINLNSYWGTNGEQPLNDLLMSSSWVALTLLLLLRHKPKVVRNHA